MKDLLRLDCNHKLTASACRPYLCLPMFGSPISRSAHIWDESRRKGFSDANAVWDPRAKTRSHTCGRQTLLHAHMHHTCITHTSDTPCTHSHRRTPDTSHTSHIHTHHITHSHTPDHTRTHKHKHHTQTHTHHAHTPLGIRYRHTHTTHTRTHTLSHSHSRTRTSSLSVHTELSLSGCPGCQCNLHHKERRYSSL